MELAQKEFELLREMVYRRTGMMFEDRKRPFMQTRVARRLPEVDCETPRDYYLYLRYHDPDGKELQAFVESLTTNETYFFREFPQLECFANEALPMVTDTKAAAGDHTLRIWSAACSTGDEPYTLAIIVRECLERFSQWDIEILATDIDTNVLDAARRGVYSERALKDVPTVYRNKYFHEHLKRYHIADQVKEMVSFSQLNLLDRPGMRRQRNFDFIFCRNVLIYFDDAARRKVLSSFYDALAPGGFVFLGHSESVGRISAAFEMVSLDGYIAYRRPLTGVVNRRVVGGPACVTR